MPVSTRSSTYLPSPVSSVGSSSRRTALPRIEPEPAMSDFPSVAVLGITLRREGKPLCSRSSASGAALLPERVVGGVGDLSSGRDRFGGAGLGARLEAAGRGESLHERGVAQAVAVRARGPRVALDQ